MDQTMFAQDNLERVQAVANSFGPSGKRLLQQGRVLVHEGRLMKCCKKGQHPRAFFLFNDVLVYGSIVLSGLWHKKLYVFALEDILLEDMEDSASMKNQWLIRTPRKSFYVSAASNEEKRAWIEHIQECKDRLPRSRSRNNSLDFANTWIPDRASAVCMRCSSKFTNIRRRRHCKKCGFLVCGACSRNRAVIANIDPAKQLRVCNMCYSSLGKVEDLIRQRWDSAGKSTENEKNEEEEEEHVVEDIPLRYSQT